MTSAAPTPARGVDGSDEPLAALDGLRILDLCDSRTAYATKLFADLGADVIMVESEVDGDDPRSAGPLLDGEPGQSLSFAYAGTNKRSITLDVSTEGGRAAFLRLVAGADAVVESFGPGVMETMGLGYEVLRDVNPAVVLTRISPFGQDGPLKDWLATDLVLWAMSGMMSLSGYADTEPLMVEGRQAYYAASLFAALGTLVALEAADSSGQGQQVDVSMQEAASMGLENAAQFWQMEGVCRTRSGTESVRAGTGLFQCVDGYVYLTASGMAERAWPRLLAWMEAWGAPGAAELSAPEWKDPAYTRSTAAILRFKALFAGFVAERTRTELYEEAQARHIPLCPVNNPLDVRDSPQLQSRGHLVETRPDGYARAVTMPGPPYRLAETPWRLRTPAPVRGSSTQDVLQEAGLAWPLPSSVGGGS